MEENMEIKLINDEVKIYEINEDVTYEELDGQGYFFVPTTDKIIVMNETSYFLWQVVIEFSNSKVELTLEELVERTRQKFDSSNITTETLKNDILQAMYHFENEDFMRAVF